MPLARNKHRLRYRTPLTWHDNQFQSGNQILHSLPSPLAEHFSDVSEPFEVRLGDSLFEPGDDITHALFPLFSTTIALALPMQDGRMIDAATIGREGIVGGVISLGVKPAFARAIVRLPGTAVQIAIPELENAKKSDPELQDLLNRYTDCLIAQILQSVGCASVHSLEARCARWLLMTHDRLQQPELPLTQEAIAEMFGVARTYVTRIARVLQDKGAISHRRGLIRIENRSLLEEASCECYGLVRRHFDRILPGLYPELEL